MDEESANKFISALIKSVQTLCHGYVDFSNGVEIIGHINLNIDKGSSFDYILKEKVCRNDENSTLFISNSFHAQPKGEQAFKPNSVQSETHVSHRRHSTDTSESNKLSSVISSISTALSGSHSQTKSRSGSRDNLTSNTHQSHPVQSTAKRKAEDDISSDLHPVKSASISRHDSSSGHQHFFTSQSPSHPSGSNSPIDSKASFIPCVGDSSQRTSTSLSDDVHSHVTATMLPQTASITSDNQSDIGVNLEGSVLERIDDRSNSETHDKDDSDLDLEVTFIKEEYVEGDRSACEFQNSSGNQALNRASNQRASSDGVQDPPLYPVALHTNASATYVPSSHEIAAMAHYAAAGAIQQNSMGMPGSSQPQPGPSGLGQSGMRGALPRECHVSSDTDAKTKEASQIFQDWLISKGIPEVTSGTPLYQLDRLLCQFYRDIPQSGRAPLKEHVIRRLRTSLFKHLSSIYHQPISLTLSDFSESNKMFFAVLSQSAPTKSTEILTPADCLFLRGHKILSVNTPLSLLRKVWFELQLHFGARSWSPKEMWPELFEFSKDSDGREFVHISASEILHADINPSIKGMILRRRMYSRDGSHCPVAALKLYLSKRDTTVAQSPLLQTPISDWQLGHLSPWYLGTELTINRVRNMMRDICEEVHLSTIYTNSSLISFGGSQYTDCWPDE